MESSRFDDLTRALAGNRSRRQLLKGLSAVALATVAGRRPGRVLAAGKVRVCHHTGAAENPVVLIDVAENAISAHQAHGDVIDPDFDNDPLNCGGCSIVCDDGDPCTINACVAGRCAFPPVECPICQVCAGGSCVADSTQEGGTCADDGDECTDQVCRSGACATEIAVGRGCDDGNACTTGDLCRADGSCAGTPIVCPDDGNPCTDQVCQAGSCNSVVVAGRACDDGNPCTTGDVCQANGACAGVPIICDNGEQCVNGDCRPVCLELQAPCTAHNQCCNGLCQDVPKGCGGEGVSQCCVSSGVRCDATCDCCGTNVCDGGVCCANVQGAVCDEQRVCCNGFQCLNGTCQPAACLHTGDICNANSECCQDEATICESSGDCGVPRGVPRCCHPNRGTCETNCDCCSGTRCEDGNCCAPEGQGCGSNGDCCEMTDDGVHFMTCRGGTCRGCNGIPSPCSSADECCAGGCSRGVCCLPNGAPTTQVGLALCCDQPLLQGDGTKCAPCRQIGQSCVTGRLGIPDNNCCWGEFGSNLCVDGVCVARPGIGQSCVESGGFCGEGFCGPTGVCQF